MSKPDPKMKKIIIQQCKEVGIDIGQGEEIWMSIGYFLKDIFKEGDYTEGPETFKNVYIKGLGSFHKLEKRINRFKDYYMNKENELIE